MISVNVTTEFTARDAFRAVKRGDLIIVIDVLRCTSTIVTALANGAKEIIPVKNLKEARRKHSENPNYLLAGERGGLKPSGFDLGNSPLEYTREKIFGRTIVLTTTSGTRTLENSKGAEWILVGSFLNLNAVTERALSIAIDEGIDICIVQSGTDGRFSLEDFICAGAIINGLIRSNVNLSDSARASYLGFKHVENDLFANIMKSEHSKRLVKLGFIKDIEFSCRVNLFPIVPFYKGESITLK
ncbi:MAG: 2-phosphosulfolactate phosphatase [Candidatus Bathyarchaeota archaeon]|nr:2-phosphosulfolactate phosphatase [Candidatus Bathyarchaeota archaeon]